MRGGWRASRAAIPFAIAAGLVLAGCGVLDRLLPAPSPHPGSPTAAGNAPALPPSAPKVSPPAPAASSAPPAAQKAPPAQGAAPAKPAKPPANAVQARRDAPAAPAAAKPAGAPPLDLKTLEQRLKETDAIGVMTKLSLRNQVDDLLGQFRDYYAGRLNATLADLRQPFELLLMKVLSLLQDSDPGLARAIHDSRDALWDILSNRDKFSKLA